MSLRPVISMMFVVASLLLVTQIGNAAVWDRDFETVSLRNGNFNLDADKTRIVTLDSWHYVQKIIVRSSAAARGAYAVWANGEQRAVIEPTAAGGTTEIDLHESISAVEFRNTRGASQVFDVTVVQSLDTVFGGGDGGTATGIDGNATQRLCRNALELVEQLRPYTNFANYGTFLLPIRKAAARAYAVAAARPSGTQMGMSLAQLEAQIASADTYLNEAFEVDAAFNLAIEVLTLRYKIEDLIH